MALAEDLGVFPSSQAGLKGPAGADLELQILPISSLPRAGLTSYTT